MGKRATKWLQDVAALASQGFPEGRARWLTMKKITDQGYTETQAMDALESQLSYEGAVLWLEDIESVMGLGFTESDAQHALNRAGSVEDAVKLLKGYRHRLWRFVVCPCRWMWSERDEAVEMEEDMEESTGLISGFPPEWNVVS